MNFLNAFADGLGTGGIYSVIALAYTIVFNICGLINFVHSELIIIGIYVIIFCTAIHLPFLLAVLISIIVCAFVNVLLERYIYYNLRTRHPIFSLITSIALAFLIRNLFVAIFSADPRNLPNQIKSSITIGNFTVEYTILFSILISVAAMLILNCVIKYTKIGKIIRAVSENSQAALLMGIDVKKVILIAFGISGVLIAIASSLYSMSYPIVDPSSGTMLGLKALAGSIIGGLGSVSGAIMGGFIVAIIELIVKSYISPQISDLVIFAIMSLVLLQRKR